MSEVSRYIPPKEKIIGDAASPSGYVTKEVSRSNELPASRAALTAKDIEHEIKEKLGWNR